MILLIFRCLYKKRGQVIILVSLHVRSMIYWLSLLIFLAIKNHQEIRLRAYSDAQVSGSSPSSATPSSKPQSLTLSTDGPLSSTGVHLCVGWFLTIWLAWARLMPCIPRMALQQSYSSALEADMFEDRWSGGACRDFLRWASHLPRARNRATDG